MAHEVARAGLHRGQQGGAVCTHAKTCVEVDPSNRIGTTISRGASIASTADVVSRGAATVGSTGAAHPASRIARSTLMRWLGTAQGPAAATSRSGARSSSLHVVTSLEARDADASGQSTMTKWRGLKDAGRGVDR